MKLTQLGITKIPRIICSTRRSESILWCCALVLAGCGGSKHPAVQDLRGRENLSLFALQAIHGTRDGDRLQTLATFSDTSSILTVEMRFAIGSPTRLGSGTWRRSRNNQLKSGSGTA